MSDPLGAAARRGDLVLFTARQMADTVEKARADERARWDDRLRAILANNVIWPESLARQFYALLNGEDDQ